MIGDRDYMRPPGADSRRPLAITLIIILVAIYLGQAFLLVYGGIRTGESLALSVDGLKHGKIWQLFTFQFLHDYPWPLHVLFNCIALFFFGPPIEEALGRERFLKVYFAGGFLGGLLQVVATLIIPVYHDNPVVGASAGIMALIGSFTTLYPMREMTVFVYFFPVTLRAHYLFWILLAYSMFGTFFPFGDTANAAHLGGLLTGVAFIHWFVERETPLFDFSRFIPRRKPAQRAANREPAFASRRTRSSTPLPEEEDPEFISKEVDPILDKISAHGIHSLTERERKILERARSKMARS